MPRTGAKITQADMARALRAARQVGAPSAEVKFPDGTTIKVNLEREVLVTVAPPLAPHREIVL